VAEFALALPTSSAAFAYDGVNRALAELDERCRVLAGGEVEHWAEARYPHQVWELELPLRSGRFEGPADVAALVEDFHELHREVFAVHDPDSPVEVVGWRARVRVPLAGGGALERPAPADGLVGGRRRAWFPETGRVDVAVRPIEDLTLVQGPAIVEAGLTTIVVPPGASAQRTETGGVLVA